MIRLVVYDLEAAVDLLQEHYPEYLVGEGGLAEAEPEVCPLQHLGRQAQRAADDEHHAPPRVDQLRQLSGELHGIHLPAVDAQAHDDIPVADSGEDRLAFFFLNLLLDGGRGIGRLRQVRQLDGLPLAKA